MATPQSEEAINAKNPIVKKGTREKVNTQARATKIIESNMHWMFNHDF